LARKPCYPRIGLRKVLRNDLGDIGLRRRAMRKFVDRYSIRIIVDREDALPSGSI